MTRTPYAIQTSSDLLKDLAEERLVIPNFQRDFEWDLRKQQRLGASILCGLPVGGMVMFSGTADSFAHRRLCVTESMKSGRSEVDYLLDGQQRLATLRSLFDDPFSDYETWEEAWKHLYPRLRTRWLLLLGNSDASQSFGARADDGTPILHHHKAQDLPSEPADIMNRVAAKRITKRDGRSANPPWWHPAFKEAAASESSLHQLRQIRNEIAKKAAAEESIPLWEVVGAKALHKRGLTPLHELTARRLGRNLEIELRALLDNDVRDPAVLDVVEQTEPGIRDELCSREDIEGSLMRTSSDWASKFIANLEGLVSVQVPTITVGSGELRRAVTIFENINEGGTPLTVFDLVNAKAVPEFETEESLRNRVRRALSEPTVDPTPPEITPLLPRRYRDTWTGNVVTGVSTTVFPAKIRNQYLNLLSILGHNQDPRQEIKGEYIKKDKQLQLSAMLIHAATDKACRGLLRACLFCQSRTGQVYPERIGYALMLLPLAIAFAEDHLFKQRNVWLKLEYWYWTSLFGGAYQLRQNEACVGDITKLYRWCVEEEISNPFRNRRDQVLSRAGYSDKGAFLEEGVSGALGDATMQFTLAGRPRDLWEKGWRSASLSAAAARVEAKMTAKHRDGRRQEFKMKLHRHHIVPLATVTKVGKTSSELRGHKESLYNSPLNMAFISRSANERIGSRAPELYLRQMPHEVLSRYYLDMQGSEIWEMIKEDDPFASPPKEAGIRKVLSGRFDKLRSAVLGRLDEIEDSLR
ncbi:MAG: DUF262 domain-containing protein [Gemmatimonadales bacterium]|nr:DUF262 domain-containing protein [Gemmatimonadales bacterium]MYG48671.1 DUF262 domain-containing protein [Gemmatimonadales bacterium]MYK02516.1 DUF262 domain-containing protein [Candidatus Palauibacter ramosifaciens]